MQVVARLKDRHFLPSLLVVALNFVKPHFEDVAFAAGIIFKDFSAVSRVILAAQVEEAVVQVLALQVLLIFILGIVVTFLQEIFQPFLVRQAEQLGSAVQVKHGVKFGKLVQGCASLVVR